jgi:hypothetical protein
MVQSLPPLADIHSWSRNGHPSFMTPFQYPDNVFWPSLVQLTSLRPNYLISILIFPSTFHMRHLPMRFSDKNCVSISSLLHAFYILPHLIPDLSAPTARECEKWYKCLPSPDSLPLLVPNIPAALRSQAINVRTVFVLHTDKILRI